MNGFDLTIAQRFNAGNSNPMLWRRRVAGIGDPGKATPQNGITDAGYKGCRHFVALKPLDVTIGVDGD